MLLYDTLLHAENYFQIKNLTIKKRISLAFGLMSRVFGNGPEDLGSIPGCFKPKTLKIVLDTSLLNTQKYKVRIKGKCKNADKGVATSPRPRCSSYWKGSLLIALDYGRQIYFYYPLGP